jgi:hypothetical protein
VANPMYLMMLEEVGQTLNISTRELQLDVKSITEYWESSLEKANISNRDTAIFFLTSCVSCYLNGRGFRISSAKMMQQNHDILVALVTLVPLYAWKQSANSYPKIVQVIPSLAEDNVHGPGDVLAQAEKILREKD